MSGRSCTGEEYVADDDDSAQGADEDAEAASGIVGAAAIARIV